MSVGGFGTFGLDTNDTEPGFIPLLLRARHGPVFGAGLTTGVPDRRSPALTVGPGSIGIRAL
jgi:hypothetical protein